MLALPPAQAAVLVTTLLFPAPLMQTKSSRLPVLPTPPGFVIVLSPALLPLAFESVPERAVIGWPVWARYVPATSHPCRKPRAKAFWALTLGRSYIHPTANLLLRSSTDRPRSLRKLRVSWGRRGLTRLLNSSLVASSMFLANV